MSTPETILDTPIEDLHITGEHPIPEWLHDAEPDDILTIAALRLDYRDGSKCGERDE